MGEGHKEALELCDIIGRDTKGLGLGVNALVLAEANRTRPG